jgi:hypothetical protein
MFKVIYLPTAEIVEITEARPSGYFDREHRVRAYLHGHACVKNFKTGKPVFINTGMTYIKDLEIPEYLLEVIEVPDEV